MWIKHFRIPCQVVASLTIIGFIGITVWQVVMTIIDYHNRPTRSTVSVERFQYPTITICHKLPFLGLNYSKIEQSLNLSKEAAVYAMLGAGFLWPSTTCLNYSLDALLAMSSTSVGSDLRVIDNEIEKTKSSMKLNDSDLIRLLLTNYSTSVSLSRCKMNGTTRNRDGCQILLTSTLNVAHGKCEVLDSTNVDSYRPMTLIFEPHIDNISAAVPFCGNILSLFFSDCPVIADPVFGQALDIYPADRKYLNMQLSQNIFSTVTGRCTETWKPTFLPDWLDKSPHYTFDHCVADYIISSFFVTKMHCVPALYKNPHGLRSCSLYEIATLTYAWRMTGDVSYSNYYWPDMTNIRSRCKTACLTSSYEARIVDTNNLYPYPEAPSTGIDIKFGSLGAIYFEESLKYDMAGWWGQIGGILGLWLGFSFLTFFRYMDRTSRASAAAWRCPSVRNRGKKDAFGHVAATLIGLPGGHDECIKKMEEEARLQKLSQAPLKRTHSASGMFVHL